MKCPKCAQARLKKVKVDQLELDHCDECGGLWLDHAHFASSIDVRGVEVHGRTWLRDVHTPSDLAKGITSYGYTWT